MPARPVTIFISSPMDVANERRRAAHVVAKLNREFQRFFQLTPVLWEYEGMISAGHFQDVIEPPPSDCDIVVMILWSRLGSPLPSETEKRQYRGLDGRAPVTGTEWEFADAWRARQTRDSPDLMVYRNTALPRIEGGAADMERAAQALRGLDAFWQRHFHNEDGTFRLAYNEFRGPDEFERMFEAHLRSWLRARLAGQAARAAGVPQEIAWHRGSPFRGLRSFEEEHAAVFFGRAAAEQQVTEALIRGDAAGAPFVLVVGPSGSGKSSLIRAGVIPDLMTPGVVEGTRVWRRAIVTPTQGAGPGTPIERLGRALVAPEALPELTADVDELIADLRDGRGASLIHRALREAVSTARDDGPGPAAQLILLVDQLEEIFSETIDAAERRTFVRALAHLASNARVWVIATLRSDFLPAWHEDETVAPLAELRPAEIWLTAPKGEELEQMIRLPAQAAGLGFDEHPETGVGLDAVLREEATGAGSLPLLEFMLEELYQADAVQRGGDVLTYESYHRLGGLSGAIGRRAEELVATLPAEDQPALEDVLLALVQLDPDGSTATARTVAGSDFLITPAHRRITEQLVAGRLVTTDSSEAGAVFRIAHEALIRHWPRYIETITQNRAFLAARRRVAAAAQAWLDDNRDLSRLLAPGSALEEGRGLLQRRAQLTTDMVAFVEASIADAEERLREQQGRERALERLPFFQFVTAGPMLVIAFAAASMLSNDLWGTLIEGAFIQILMVVIYLTAVMYAAIPLKATNTNRASARRVTSPRLKWAIWSAAALVAYLLADRPGLTLVVMAGSFTWALRLGALASARPANGGAPRARGWRKLVDVLNLSAIVAAHVVAGTTLAAIVVIAVSVLPDIPVIVPSQIGNHPLLSGIDSLLPSGPARYLILGVPLVLMPLAASTGSAARVFGHNRAALVVARRFGTATVGLLINALPIGLIVLAILGFGMTLDGVKQMLRTLQVQIGWYSLLDLIRYVPFSVILPIAAAFILVGHQRAVVSFFVDMQTPPPVRDVRRRWALPGWARVLLVSGAVVLLLAANFGITRDSLRAVAAVEAIQPALRAHDIVRAWVKSRADAGMDAETLVKELGDGYWHSESPSSGLATMMPELATIEPADCEIRLTAGPLTDPAAAPSDERTQSVLRYCLRTSCASPQFPQFGEHIALFSSHPSSRPWWTGPFTLNLFGSGMQSGATHSAGGYCTADGTVADRYQG